MSCSGGDKHTSELLNLTALVNILSSVLDGVNLTSSSQLKHKHSKQIMT